MSGHRGRKEDEVSLVGGNASRGVVRVGDTVRKPWLPTTPAVHELMSTVAASGVDVPRPLGRDEHGRQVLEHVPGKTAMEETLTPSELARVGALVRAIHDASEGFEPSSPTPWEPLIPVARPDLVCHHDLAPWNLVVAERWVFIDWDGAGPSTRLWDLAYAAQTFTLSDVELDPVEAAADLAALVDGYAADDELRRQLPVTLGTRAAAMHDLLLASYRSGREPWGSMYADGHGAHWRRATEYAVQHRDVWAAALSPRRRG